MKTLRLTGFIIGMMGLFCFTSCEETESNEPSAAGKEVQKIVTELEKIPEISQFTGLLKNTTIPQIETNQLTVFAVKNPELFVSRATESNLNNESIMRHVVVGAYTMDQLKDSMTLTTINKETLLVTKVDTTYAINNVPLETKGMKVGNSMVYMVPTVIPETENIIPDPNGKKDVTIIVKRINAYWTPVNNAPGFSLQGAQITAYKKDGSVLGTYYTDYQGSVKIEHNEPELSFVAVKGDSLSNIDNGFVVEGLFMSEQEISEWAQYVGITAPKPGSLKYADLNQDAIIDSRDKIANNTYYRPVQYINDAKTATVTVYLTSNKFSGNWDQLYTSELTSWVTKRASFFDITRLTDAQICNQIPATNIFTSNYFSVAGKTVWDAGYQVIAQYKKMENLFGANSQAPQYLRERWASESQRMGAECALTYTQLSHFYGNISIMTNVNEKLPSRSYEALVEYMQNLENILPEQYSYAVTALLGRLFLNKNDYDRAKDRYMKIIRSGKYALATDTNAIFNNVEKNVILGGYGDNVSPIRKGRFYHPIRYTEVLLSAAECELSRGDMNTALNYLQQIRASKNQPPISPDQMIVEKLRTIIHNMWREDMKFEAFTYAAMRRSVTFLSTFGKDGAQEKHLYLPISSGILSNHPNIIQNPGY